MGAVTTVDCFGSSKLVSNKESNGVLRNGSPWRNKVKMKNVQGTRRKVLFLAALIGIGIIMGSVVLYAINGKDETGSWELELENGKIVLDAQDRTELKEKSLDVALEDEGIKELIAGKDYTTQVTLTGNVTVEGIIEEIRNQTKRGIVAEGDVNLIVVVTVTFEDGSGYNIPVDWQNWTVGEPEFAQQVTPPANADEFRITGFDTTRRTAPTERTTYFP
jgi:hypothetical protein